MHFSDKARTIIEKREIHFGNHEVCVFPTTRQLTASAGVEFQEELLALPLVVVEIHPELRVATHGQVGDFDVISGCVVVCVCDLKK